MKAVLVLVSVAALGAVAATLYVGSQVFERTVVDDPYEHAIHYDQERQARQRLGWRAAFEPASLRPGAGPIAFALLDRSGAPVDGAAVRLALTRPAGGGDDLRGQARPLGGGRYAADLAFPAPGFWDVRLDVSRGPDAVALVQQVRVEAAAAPPCDLAAAPCAAPAGPFALELDLGRDLATMRTLPAAVTVRRGGAPVEGAAVEVSFAMQEMNMGENRVALAPAGGGRYAGPATLVRCHSGKKGWVATVTVRAPGEAPASASFPFAVRE